MKSPLVSRTATDNQVAGISFAHGSVDFTRREIIFSIGKRLPISRLQVELLRYLAARPGVAVTRDELLTNVWKIDASRTFTRTVDMHVSLLRRKLGDNPDRPEILVTVHGCGYLLVADSDAAC